MAAIVPVLVVLAIVVYYVVYAKRGGGAGATNRHFGLADGENTVAFWSAEFAAPISFGTQAATAALGLLAGAMVGGVGIATMRPRGISIVLTSHHRLVMCVENEDGSTSLLAFEQGQVGVHVVSPGHKRMQGGPSVILRFVQGNQPPLDVCIHESAQGMIPAWAAGQRVA